MEKRFARARSGPQCSPALAGQLGVGRPGRQAPDGARKQDTKCLRADGFLQKTVVMSLAPVGAALDLGQGCGLQAQKNRLGHLPTLFESEKVTCKCRVISMAAKPRWS